MKKSLIVLITLFVLILTSCNKEVTVPFDINPESQITIDYMEDIANNYDEYVQQYYNYSVYNEKGLESQELNLFLEEKEAEGLKDAFISNSEKYTILQSNLTDAAKIEIINNAKNMIDDYLKNSRLLGEEQHAYGFTLSKQFEEQKPKIIVSQFLQYIKIKVTDIEFPETFEEIDWSGYPLKFTYKYILKGTRNLKEFEEEVTQNFYIGIEWIDEGNTEYVIEYIQ